MSIHIARTLAVAFAVCFLFASQAAAKSTTLFGPESFVKPVGKPVTMSKSFTVPKGAKNFKLWVKTGENGREMGKNTKVYVNDTLAVTAADLRKSNPVFKPISLKPGENVVDVSLKGNEGNYIMLYVTGEVSDKIIYLKPSTDSPKK